MKVQVVKSNIETKVKKSKLSSKNNNLEADYIEHFQPWGWPRWNVSPSFNTKALFLNQMHDYTSKFSTKAS